jgi:iron complex transport system substrate-binding protein
MSAKKGFLVAASVLLVLVTLCTSCAGSSITQWNSETEDGPDIPVDIHIGESKEVEFTVSSDLSYDWIWSINGEEVEESRGESSDLSYPFAEYGIYDVRVTGLGENETTVATWNVTVSLVIDEENDIRVLEGLEDYTFKISKRPERIVSMAPSATEILFAVGAGDSVIGVTDYCDYPPEVKEKKDNGEIKSIGGYSTPSLEKIVDLEPDLIVAAHGNPSELLYWLVDTNVHPGIEYPVYAQHPDTIEEIFAHMETIGALTKCDVIASSLVAELREDLQEIEEKTESLEEGQRPRVYYAMGSILYTPGEGTFQHEVIELAGGENIAAKYLSSWGVFSIEKLIDEDPQVILYSGHGSESIVPDQIKSDERLSTIDAVKKDRIYLINEGEISRPGPRLVNATEKVLECLYGLFNVPIIGSTEINGAYFGVLNVTLELSAEENIALRLNITEVKVSEMEIVPETVIGNFVRIEVNESESGNLEILDKVVIKIRYDEVELEEADMEETRIRICYYNASEEEWKTVKTNVYTEDNIASAEFSCLNDGIYGLTFKKK